MILIRPATVDDRFALWSLHTASIRRLCASHYPAEQVERWAGFLTPERYTEALTDPRRHFVVAERDGRIAGFGQLNVDASEIEAVYVHPDHAGAGVGREIMRHLEERARAARLSSLHLTATLNAVSFYERRGFRITGHGEFIHPSGVVLACTFMEKALPVSA